jgi:dipeptidyl aminopeptidase/acylaminoacyl peptidase
VQRAESEQIVAAMKERGIDHEYAMYENEGHGYHRTDRFLAKHLGGRAE